MTYDIKYTLPTNAAQFSPQEATAALHAILLQPMDGQTLPEVMSLAVLRSRGADMNAPDAHGLTPLLRCLSWPYNEGTTDFQEVSHWALSFILDSVDLDAVTPDGLTAKQLAAQWQDSTRAVQHLECEAYRRSQPDLIHDCNGIDPAWPKPGTPVNEDIQRSFIKACDQGLINQAAYLLHLYPDAHTWTYNESTGIFFALNSRPEMVKLLLKHGADINAQDEKNMTVLHYACSNKEKAHFIPLLVEAGADTTLRNIDRDGMPYGNQTPRGMAECYGLPESVQILDDACEARAQKENAALQRGAIQRRSTIDGKSFKL